MSLLKKQYQLAEVFGINNRCPATYVFRQGIDDLFKDAIQTNRSIVIHGSIEG